MCSDEHACEQVFGYVVGGGKERESERASERYVMAAPLHGFGFF